METGSMELKQLCSDVKKMIYSERIEEARKQITMAMAAYPDASQPHNLMGILKEVEHDRSGAVRHFRAAYALNPHDKAVRNNLDILCFFRSSGKKLQFGDEEEETKTNGYVVEYDENGIGHIVRKKA